MRSSGLKVLVTGASGFVGVNLVRWYAAAGHDVHAVDLAEPSTMARWFLAEVQERIRTVTSDLRDPAWGQVMGAPSDFDLIIHCAAVTPLTPHQESSRAIEAIDVNVGGTARLMSWASVSPGTRVIHISSGSVYGPRTGAPVPETAPQRPHSIYAITKAASEAVALRLGSLFDIAVAAVRLAQPYGMMERATTSRPLLSPIHDWCIAGLSEEPLRVAGLRFGRDYSAITDITEGVLKLSLLRRWDHRVYNLGSGKNIRLGRVLQIVRSHFPGSMVGPGVPYLDRETARPPLAIERIVRETGWRPVVGIEDGIEDYIRWLRAARAFGASGDDRGGTRDWAV
jgi:nucleoside-diphosphate-sugar epimerase